MDCQQSIEHTLRRRTGGKLLGDPNIECGAMRIARSYERLDFMRVTNTVHQVSAGLQRTNNGCVEACGLSNRPMGSDG